MFTTYVLIAAGVLVLLVGVVGCCGVLKENRCALLTFCFLLLGIFLLEACSGIMAYMYSDQIQTELTQNLNRTFADRYGIDDTITKATTQLHREFHCCGAINYQDWTKSKWYQTVNKPPAVREPGAPPPELTLVPQFCCKSETSGCGRRDHPSNIYTEGCIEALTEEIRDHEIILGAIALGLSTVQLFGMVLSCCLYVKLKDFEDYKRERARNNYY